MRALVPLQRGDCVAEYVGERLTNKDADARLAGYDEQRQQGQQPPGGGSEGTGHALLVRTGGGCGAAAVQQLH